MCMYSTVVEGACLVLVEFAEHLRGARGGDKLCVCLCTRCFKNEGMHDPKQKASLHVVTVAGGLGEGLCRAARLQL